MKRNYRLRTGVVAVVASTVLAPLPASADSIVDHCTGLNSGQYRFSWTQDRGAVDWSDSYESEFSRSPFSYVGLRMTFTCTLASWGPGSYLPISGYLLAATAGPSRLADQWWSH